MNKTENKQVKRCITKCCGHLHSIEIVLEFDNCTIHINPKRNWFADKGVNKLGHKESTMPFYELFDVFDIDCEDSGYFENFSGKYCRLISDEDDRLLAIQHITKDNIVVLLKDLK